MTRRGPGHTVAVLTTDERHANPHGTVHGAVFYAVAGAAVAAAANDADHSGIISSVLVEYLHPAALGDELHAEVTREVSTDREDIFTGSVRRTARRATCWPGCAPGAPAGPVRAEPRPAGTRPTTGQGTPASLGRICGNHVIDARPPSRRVGPMRQRHVVIVAFEGLQPLDAVGPHEVFAGAGQAAASLGRAGRLPGLHRLRRRWHRQGRERPRARHEPRCPRRPTASTRSSCRAARGPRRPPPRTPNCWPGSAGRRRAAAGWPRCARAPSSAPRRGCWRAAGSPRTGPGPGSSPTPTRASSWTPTRSTSATASTGRAPGSPRASTSSLALVQEDLGVDVAQTVARWLVMFLHRPGGPDAVRLAGLGPPRRALDGPGRADPRRGGPGRRPPSAAPSRRPPP